MLLSFKKQFKQPILDGIKIHTIREDKHDRWKPGKKIHFATGVRTKDYECFKEGICVSIQRIKIKHIKPNPYRVSGEFTIPLESDTNGKPKIEELKNTFSIYIDGRALEINVVKKLIYNDGFYNLADFINWFDADFEGKIIHWTNFKY